ncbi:hypothetical protein [Sphingorhabdus sp.]|uniref:hypothetical protein n=1 Tax=Sphingorhabdus sp. TaxID=1902408 RepID=UPI0035936C9A
MLSSPTTPRTALILRWITAGPLAIIAAVLTMASTPLWLPKGAAGVDHMILPIILFPAFWAIFFFYALIEARPIRALVIFAVVMLANAVVIYLQF